MAAAAIPLAIAAAGTAAEARGEQVQASKRRDLLNQALMRTDKTQQDTNNRILTEASSLAPTTRAATMQTQADANTAQSKADLSAAGATDPSGNAIINTSGDNGAVSGDFLKAKADRALTEGTRLSAIAQQLAQVRAPGQLEQQEGQRRGDLTENVASMWGTTNADNNATKLDAEGIQAPGYAKVGKIAKLAALAYLAGGAGLGAAGAGAGAGAGTVWAGGDGAAAGLGGLA